MLFLISGASGSGKTACLPHLQPHVPHIPIHDFDERGVPSDADKAWRQQHTEHWLQQALVYQAEGRDMILAGQLPFGEVLACPSAPQLNGTKACLLDCYDPVRMARLRQRGTYGITQDMLCWAAWLRMHTVDPQWRPDVIQDESWPEMHWAIWQDWLADDPRWQTQTLDTTSLTLPDVAQKLAIWIQR